MTYFVFRDDIVKWRGHRVEAWFVDHVDYKRDVQPHWWEAKPLAKPLPPLRISINTKQPILDNYRVGIFELYSAKLIRLLQDVGIYFEAFRATIVDRSDRPIPDVAYSFFHLLEMYPVIDVARSDIGAFLRSNPPDDVPINSDTFYMQNLVLLEERPSDRKLLFRDAEFPYLTIIHEDLKRVLQEAKIAGCRYIPFEEYRYTLFGSGKNHC